jgi:hypothetical protein
MCARKISSTRVCHPAPVLRNAATTSGDNRMETGTFFGAICSPRLRLESTRCKPCGKPLKGTARANSAFVHSGLSLSTFRLVAVFVVAFLILARLSQADCPHILAFLCENKCIQPRIQKSNRLDTHFAIIFSIVNHEDRSVEIEVSRAAQPDAMLFSIDAILAAIEQKLHEPNVYTI